jgi:hypothetical protein
MLERVFGSKTLSITHEGGVLVEMGTTVTRPGRRGDGIHGRSGEGMKDRGTASR